MAKMMALFVVYIGLSRTDKHCLKEIRSNIEQIEKQIDRLKFLHDQLKFQECALSASVQNAEIADDEESVVFGELENTLYNTAMQPTSSLQSVRHWQLDTVVQWLYQRGLGVFVPIAKREVLDGERLIYLDEPALQEMGLGDAVLAKVIIREIYSLHLTNVL